MTRNFVPTYGNGRAVTCGSALLDLDRGRLLEFLREVERNPNIARTVAPEQLSAWAGEAADRIEHPAANDALLEARQDGYSDGYDDGLRNAAPLRLALAWLFAGVLLGALGMYVLARGAL
jgi:hypothetical protein